MIKLYYKNKLVFIAMMEPTMIYGINRLTTYLIGRSLKTLTNNMMQPEEWKTVLHRHDAVKVINEDNYACFTLLRNICRLMDLWNLRILPLLKRCEIALRLLCAIVPKFIYINIMDLETIPSILGLCKSWFVIRKNLGTILVRISKYLLLATMS